jgi:hypothetical protein
VPLPNGGRANKRLREQAFAPGPIAELNLWECSADSPHAALFPFLLGRFIHAVFQDDLNKVMDAESSRPWVAAQ